MAENTQLTAGLDAGSAAVKVAILRSQAGNHAEVVATSVQRIRRREVAEVCRIAFAEACQRAGVQPTAFDYVASTGEADQMDFAHGHFYGMTTHGRGALVLDPATRCVMDVGALHARAIKVDERGRVLGHRMTSQCASGSGQFVENIARYLGVPLEDVGALSVTAKKPEEVSSICAVLAETDVINMVSRGVSTADILKGIHLSSAGRLARLIRAVGAEGTVLLTGGMAADKGLIAALKESLSEAPSKKKDAAVTIDVHAHELSPLAGAVGAAALGAFRFDQLRRAGRWDVLKGAREGAAAAV
ncbi:MAG: benzoyl-CoA reductase subunit D [Deltaproteobacteria bacterium]|nr:benzoyl-CoA reductase subunit D [Deltaproteobacteria bacterium]